MKDEVKRILKLVQDGKLSPDDAAELIEAFEGTDDAAAEDSETPRAEGNPADAPGHAAASSDEKSPWSQLVEAIERLGREVATSVDWRHVAEQAKAGANRGVEAIRVGVEKIRAHDFDVPWQTNVEVREMELPLSLPNGKSLKIVNPCGSVRVIGGSAVGSVKARARVRGSSPEDAKMKANAYLLVLEESDRYVVVKQPDISGLEVELTATIDRGDVEVLTESGDIELDQTRGACTVRGRSGDVKIAGADRLVDVTVQSGSVRVHDSTGESISVETKSGDVTGNGLKGALSVRTASGDIDLDGVESSSVSVDAVSGDASVKLRGIVQGTISVRTVSGQAVASVPADASLHVSLSTLRGSAKSYLPLADEAKADERITGKLGEGTGRLDISSVTGDVALKSS